MNYKKTILTISAAAISAILITSNLASAANLNQAVTNLPVNDEWAIMAYASVGQTVGQTFLSQPITSGIATDIEKRILAITAQGGNAQGFVTQLEGLASGGQIGDSSLLNDDIFGILALTSAGVSDNVVSSSRQFLLSHQNSNGGFGSVVGTGSDSNMTAAAVAALAATGSAPASAISYLQSAQTASGGYGFTPGQTADSGSTAWVMWGLTAAGQSIPTSATSFLNSLQLSNGTFKWHASDSTGSLLMTAYSVIALSGHTLPIRTVSIYQTPYATPYGYQTPNTYVYQTPYGYQYQTPYATPYGYQYQYQYQTPATSTGIRVTVTYPKNKFFDGTVTSATPLNALIAAAGAVNFPYKLNQTTLGSFIQSIDGYGSSGASGWQYAVNGIVPTVAADAYTLKSGDLLQWFYGSPQSAPY